MKVVRVVAIVVAGVLAFALLVIGGSWLGTAGPREQASALIAAVRAGDPGRLEPLLHPGLLQKASAERFMQMTRTWGLHEPGELSWREWSIATDGAQLKGAIVRGADGSQPLDLRFLRHEGQWKLVSLDTELAGLVTDPMALQVPPPQELTALLAQTTRDFGAGMQDGGFARLHASMSRNARAKYAVQDLDAAFAGFLERPFDIEPVVATTPLLASPAGIEPDGVLVASGHYPSRPLVLHFTYRFHFDQGAWRLFGLDMESVPAATARGTADAGTARSAG